MWFCGRGEALSLLFCKEVAYFREEEFLFGRFGFGWGGLLGWAEAVELFDEYEDGKCGEGKADDIGEEEPVVEGRRAGFLGGFEGGVGCARKVPVEFGEVDLVKDEPHRRHEDI